MMLSRTKSDRAVPRIMRHPMHHAAPAKGVSFQQQPWLCGPVYITAPHSFTRDLFEESSDLRSRCLHRAVVRVL